MVAADEGKYMRHIHAELFTDEFFGPLEPVEWRLLWIGLVIRIADDQGRMIDNPMMIKAQLFPFDGWITGEFIDKGLAAFTKHQKIIRYQAGAAVNGSGRKLIQIRNWWKYQKSAHWAARSHYPPPSKWIDRIRTHEGQTIIQTNWDHPGGYEKPTKPKVKHPANVGPALGQRNANASPTMAGYEDEDRRRDSEGEEDPSLPPTSPPIQAKDGRTDGTAPKANRTGSLDQLKPKQRKAAEAIGRVMRAASFRDDAKLDTLRVLVATRSSGRDPIVLTLGALASAYENDGARDPVGMAAYQLERGTVDLRYCDPKHWGCLPREVLSAAGIDDLLQYRLDHRA